MPSNRKFGEFFTAIFAAATAYAYWKQHTGWAAGLAALAVLLGIVTVAAPGRLEPFNRLWFRLGMLLGKIVSPIVLGLMFLLLITPVAVLGRLFGRDALALKPRGVASYWVDRQPPGPEPESFKNQF